MGIYETVLAMLDHLIIVASDLLRTTTAKPSDEQVKLLCRLQDDLLSFRQYWLNCPCDESMAYKRQVEAVRFMRMDLYHVLNSIVGIIRLLRLDSLPDSPLQLPLSQISKAAGEIEDMIVELYDSVILRGDSQAILRDN